MFSSSLYQFVCNTHLIQVLQRCLIAGLGKRTFVFDLADLAAFTLEDAKFFLSMDVQNKLFSALCGQNKDTGEVTCKAVNTQGLALSSVHGQSCYEFLADSWFQHPAIRRKATLTVTVKYCQESEQDGGCGRRVQDPFLIISSSPRLGGSACPTIPISALGGNELLKNNDYALRRPY